jgi:hypothetical protein
MRVVKMRGVKMRAVLRGVKLRAVLCPRVPSVMRCAGGGHQARQRVGHPHLSLRRAPRRVGSPRPPAPNGHGHAWRRARTGDRLHSGRAGIRPGRLRCSPSRPLFARHGCHSAEWQSRGRLLCFSAQAATPLRWPCRGGITRHQRVTSLDRRTPFFLSLAQPPTGIGGTRGQGRVSTAVKLCSKRPSLAVAQRAREPAW